MIVSAHGAGTVCGGWLNRPKHSIQMHSPSKIQLRSFLAPEHRGEEMEPEVELRGANPKATSVIT